MQNQRAMFEPARFVDVRFPGDSREHNQVACPDRFLRALVDYDAGVTGPLDIAREATSVLGQYVVHAYLVEDKAVCAEVGVHVTRDQSGADEGDTPRSRAAALAER